jgi:hypothetical protein
MGPSNVSHRSFCEGRSVTRLESLYAEFNALAAETLQTLALMEKQDREQAERMRVVTQEAIKCCDQILEKCS